MSMNFSKNFQNNTKVRQTSWIWLFRPRFWQMLCIVKEIYQKKHVNFRLEYVITGRNKNLILLCNRLRKRLVKEGNCDYLH